MFAIENLRKTFIAPGNVVVNAVDGINLGIETGKLITLLGPSGCGKTTTLRCLAGLERPEVGRIVIANETVCDIDKGIHVSASDRGIGMVFQSYALWPHMTVFENVAFPLRVARDRKYSSAEVKEKVNEEIGKKKEELIAQAKAERDRLIAEAEKQAADAKAKAREEAARVKKQGYDAADAELKKVTNPFAKVAAKLVADKAKQEADKKEQQVIAEADKKADGIVVAARQKGDDLVKKAEATDTTVK